jgi:hypothetical protein
MSPLLLDSLLLTFALFSQAPNGGAPPENEVLRWNRIATDALEAAATDPLTESRILAIVQISVHDALNAIEPRAVTYTTGVGPAGAAAPDAAVASAAHDALVQLFPGAKATLDEELSRSLTRIADRDLRARGVDLGRRSAAAILALRAHDGADQPIDVPAGTAPGAYRPTPPDETPAMFGQWGAITPFALQSSAQFRPVPPPAVDSALAQREVALVRAIGGQDSTTRNDEQSEIARFWYENSTQGWNRIARNVARSSELDAWDSARLLALVNIAMADGFIAGFEAKYHYLFWRPATAIRASGDGDWLSYLVTPPVPDHPSTHTVLGAAAATVLARFFESDYVAFETSSGQPYPGLTRRFWSFSEAAQENGQSRVLAGLHFPSAVRAGYRLGEDVGTWVFEHALLPRAVAGEPVASKTALLR